MSEHADIVAVQYPRGKTALVWCDLATGVIATNHPGLRGVLRRGLRDWRGYVANPREGHRFLAAVYDYFFINGYAVQWLSVSGLKGLQNTYRV
jgi:hypothetical protein